MFSTAEQMKKVSSLSSILIGICVDNLDPLKLGRIRIQIPNMFEVDKSVPESPNFDGIPWAIPIQPLITGGVSSSSGSFCVPEINQEVTVMFTNNDIYHPFYFGTIQSSKSSHTIFNDNYPNMYGSLDSSGTWHRVDKENDTVEYFHNSGFKFVIYKNGDVGISMPGNLFMNTEGNNHFGVQRGENNLVNNIANVIGVLGKGLGQIVSDDIQPSPFISTQAFDNSAIQSSGSIDGTGENKAFTNQVFRLQDGKALENILLKIPGGIETVLADYPGGMAGFSQDLYTNGIIPTLPKSLQELMAALELVPTPDTALKELVRQLPKGIYTLFDYIDGGVSIWINEVGATIEDRQEAVSELVTEDTTLLIQALLSNQALPKEAVNALNDMNLSELLELGKTITYIKDYITALPSLKVNPTLLDPPVDASPLDVLNPTGYQESGRAIFNLISAEISSSDAAAAITTLSQGAEIKKMYALNVFSGINLPLLTSEEYGWTFAGIVAFINSTTEFFDSFDQATSFFEEIGTGATLGAGITELLLAEKISEQVGSAQAFIEGIQTFMEDEEILEFNPATILKFAADLKLSEIVSITGGLTQIMDHVLELLNDYLNDEQRVQIMLYGVGLGDAIRTKIPLDNLMEIYASTYRVANNPIVGSETDEAPEGISEGLPIEALFSGSFTELYVRQFLNNTDFQKHRSLDLLNQDGKVKLINKDSAGLNFSEIVRKTYDGNI